jgi:hypothetical protein
MKESAVEWLENKIEDQRENGNTDLRTTLHYCQKAKEIEKQQKQQTIEEVFEWLTKNNYVTDLKETLIEQLKNQ